MPYTAPNIKDRVAVGDDIYQIIKLDDGRYQLIPDPDSVVEPGTPVNKALLQGMADAIEAAFIDIPNNVPAMVADVLNTNSNGFLSMPVTSASLTTSGKLSYCTLVDATYSRCIVSLQDGSVTLKPASVMVDCTFSAVFLADKNSGKVMLINSKASVGGTGGGITVVNGTPGKADAQCLAFSSDSLDVGVEIVNGDIRVYIRTRGSTERSSFTTTVNVMQI